MDYNYFMGQAIGEAGLAYGLNEVPIGCVIVYQNKIIAKGHNQRNRSKNSLYHAEILAINQACEFMRDWRLEDCHMFVTVEPCPMCAGAIVQARIKSLIYGTPNKKAGSCGSVINLLEQEGFNHRVEIQAGVMQSQCAALMSDFFAGLRKHPGEKEKPDPGSC